jgi:hypothetical protein
MKKAKKHKGITEVLGKEHANVKGQEAIDTLFREESGHVKDAFRRDDIGGISIAWGDDDFGLQHIIKRRTEQGIDPYIFLNNFGQVIERGKLQSNARGNYEIKLGGKVVVVTPSLRESGMQYMLTAFRTRKSNDGVGRYRH